MKLQYKNQQEDADPMNGMIISSSAQLITALDARRNDQPFFVRLSGDNGFELMIGLGGDIGCAQYSRSDGKPPYLVAVSALRPMKNGNFEFLMGGTATPVPARNILSFDELKQIALHFLQTGERSDGVSWDSI